MERQPGDPLPGPPLRAYKKTPPQREPVDVAEIVSEMVSLLRNEANDHAVSIHTDLLPTFPKSQRTGYNSNRY
jgi:hypothetical protein